MERKVSPSEESTDEVQTLAKGVDVGAFRRVRYLMAFLSTLSVTVAFSMRVTMSIAIVGMTDNETNDNFETFDWDSETKSTVLSSFFWGYVATNILGGVLLTRYGPRWILLMTMIFSVLCTVFTPLAAHSGGWEAVVVLRVIQGIVQGSVLPAVHQLLSQWAPVSERGFLASICFSGMQMASILTLSVSGALAASRAGWPSIFYVFACFGVIWCLLWYFFGYNSPAEHPYITETERTFIESFCAKQSVIGLDETPWKEIFTSIPMLAIIVSHCCQNWGYYVIMTEMPTYMNDILLFNITHNGLLTALPFIGKLFVSFFVGWLSDLLISRQIIQLNTSRKLFNAIGFLGPMTTMIGLSYVGHAERGLAVALLVLSASINGSVYVGFQVNHLDLSPNFASIMMGITNSIGNVSSMLVPYVVSAVVTDEESEDQWHTVFWITAGVYLFGTVVFTLFGVTTTQPWNERKKREEENQP